MRLAARIAVLSIALAAHAISFGAGQGGVIRIVALDSTVELPGGWKLVEDAGPRGCAFETPEGVRVDVVVWVPRPPAQGSWDERHAAWEHGILLKRSCDFISRRERQVPGPLGGRGLLVSGRARTGEHEWAGAYLAFRLDAQRACVIGAFAPTFLGDETPTSAIFQFVAALQAAHRETLPIVVPPDEPSLGGSVAIGSRPGDMLAGEAQATGPSIVAAQATGESPALVAHPRPPAEGTAKESTSSRRDGPRRRETSSAGSGFVPSAAPNALAPAALRTDLPARPARLELTDSPPAVPAIANRHAEDTQVTPAYLGAAVATLPERASIALRGSAAGVHEREALADTRPLLAALASTSVALPGLRELVLGNARPGSALPEGRYTARPWLASALPAVASRPADEPAAGAATAQPVSVLWLVSKPPAPAMAVVDASRLLPPVRMAMAWAGPNRKTAGAWWATSAQAAVVRERASRPAAPDVAATRPEVGPRAWALAARVERRFLNLPQPFVMSATASSVAVLAAGGRPTSDVRRVTAAADVRLHQPKALLVAAVPSQVGRVAPGAAVAAPSSTEPGPSLGPAQPKQVSSRTRPLDKPLGETPASSGPTAGWAADESGLLRVRVPLGWRVSVKVTDSSGVPAIAVYGSHAQEPNLRFAWLQPSMPRYRDLTQLLTAMGYREWEWYRDTASGEQLIVAKRRGARRFLEDVVLPDRYGGLHTWQILDAQPSATAAGLSGSGEGLVAHVMALGDRGAVEGWYSVATGTPSGQSAQTWVGAWLAALGPPGDRRPLEALVHTVAGAEATGSQAGQQLWSMVLAAQAAAKDLTRSAHPGP